MSSTAPSKKPYRKAPPQHRELRPELPAPWAQQEVSIIECQESLTDSERMKLLQQENEELRRRLASATSRTEALERELEIGQDYLELELGQSREELDKFKDKFRRLQNSYTASQRNNQELEDKLHTLIKKAEMDRKTLDWEIVELTNKLLDAKTTINKLEELNERYRQDCNLAVQLLKCNKSHFRNHKFADLPYELQDMVSKHLHSTQDAPGPSPGAPSLAPGAVVPTSVIARVLEKPESLLLNSAQSGSAGHPVAEDVFVHVDMSEGVPGNPASPTAPRSPTSQANGECCPADSVRGSSEEELLCEKLSPYPTPPPPHPLYPGRKVIEFSEDKVRIPRNSPLPNCTYATRQAISLSLVEEGSDRARLSPGSPASAQASPRPLASPPSAPSAVASSASSEEDLLLASWQRAFVDRAPPPAPLTQRTGFGRDALPDLRGFAGNTSDDNEDTDPMPSSPVGEGCRLLSFPSPPLSRDDDELNLNLPVSPAEECQKLLPEEGGEGLGTPPGEGKVRLTSHRPQRSPKRMGVHHLHRKDSLTQAQEQGNLLN